MNKKLCTTYHSAIVVHTAEECPLCRARLLLHQSAPLVAQALGLPPAPPDHTWRILTDSDHQAMLALVGTEWGYCGADCDHAEVERDARVILPELEDQG